MATPLRVVSAINARVRNQDVSGDPRVGAHLPEGALRTVHREASGTWGAVVQRTRTTRLAVVAAADHELGATRSPDLPPDRRRSPARTASR